MPNKPLLYLKDGTAVPQCYEMLPFHHAAYEVQRCSRREGHEGAHRCNVLGCGRRWKQRIDREQFWEEVAS